MINNKDKTDELFRKSLEGYQAKPSRKVWSRIESRFFGPGHRRATITGTILLFTILAGGLLTLILWPENDSRNDQYSLPAASDAVTAGHPAHSIQPEVAKSESIPAETVNLNTGGVTTFANPSGTSPITSVPSNDDGGNSEITGKVTVAEVPFEMDHDMIRSIRSIFRLKGFSTGLINPEFSFSSPKRLFTSATQPIYPGLGNIYVRNTDLQIGMNFFPAAAFYPENPTRQAIQGEIIFRAGIWSGIFLETGLGISVVEDMGEYQMNYETFDSVGYYMNVTSFSIDPQDPAKIILNLSPETLFDSIPHEQKVQEPYRYTYLYFPLSVGWKFYQYKRMSLSLRGGGKFCLLISKNEPAAEFNLSEAELISTESLVPSRQPTTWLFSAGLGFGYELNRNLHFNLEPVFEQYIKDPYKSERLNGRDRNPYLFGIRAGLSYSF